MQKLSFICALFCWGFDPVFAESAQLPSPVNQGDTEVPSYQPGKLKIPRIDTQEQVGKYLNATFSATKTGGWQLETYQEAGINYLPAPIKSVELVTVDAQPKQVFLHIKGEFTGCGSLGTTYTRLENKTFNVVVNDGFDQALAPLTLCTADIKPFEKTIALPVFELSADTYSYTVNNKFPGKFTLTSDNVLPETSPIVCTLEAKQCPDGSYVGRTGPACEFAPCPSN